MQGCEGVEEVLALLRGELELAMKLSGEGGWHGSEDAWPLSCLHSLSGCAALSDITPAMVVHERELPLARP